MASGKRIVAVLFIVAFVAMSAVQASEGADAGVMPLAADDAGLGARRALTQWYRFGRGRRNGRNDGFNRGGRDYYRDHFERHRGRDGGYDCGEGNSAAAAAAAASAGYSAASAAAAGSACRGYRG